MHLGLKAAEDIKRKRLVDAADREYIKHVSTGRGGCVCEAANSECLMSFWNTEE